MGSLANRRAWLISSTALTTCCVWLACAPSTRYKVLSFFFEGVPDPSAVAEQLLAEEGKETREPGSSTEGQGGMAAAQSDAPQAVRLHPPYQLFRCVACHAADGGNVMQTPQEGLCRQCHDIPDALVYAHGPVAVSDCLFCHHHHGGEHEKMLRVEPRALCVRCHDRADLTEGEHHAATDEPTCMDCHHGHGGDNRFFLKPDRP